MPLVLERIKNVKEFRLKSTKEATRRKAQTPTLLDEERIPMTDFLVMPVVSSENRDFIPIAYKNPPDICYASAFFIENADLYLFGILNSTMHNAWMRTITGRLKSDYRYSNTIVYNNFPFPNPTEERKAKIEQTAQAILDARSQFPEASLADLYNPLTMPPVLRKAHEANDKAVEKAYGKTFSNDDERVAFLFEKYVEMTK